MRGIIKYVFILFCLIACVDEADVLSSKELNAEFQNVWWEFVDDPIFVDDNSTFCYIFSDGYEVEAPDDGTIFYYEEDNIYSYVLSNFRCIEDGYYVSEYNMMLEVLIDDHDNYSVRARQGIFTQTADIIPCSLKQ